MSKYLKDRDGKDTMFLSNLKSARATNTAFVYNRMQGSLDRFFQSMVLVEAEKVNWSNLWAWVHEHNFQAWALDGIYSPAYYEDEAYDNFDAKE